MHLIEHRDRIVSKDELLQEIWQGRVVSDSTITSRMASIRKALGDSGEDQRFVRTFSRHGFRFVGEVVEQRADEDLPPPDGESPSDVSHPATTADIGATAERRWVSILLVDFSGALAETTTFEPYDVETEFDRCMALIETTAGEFGARVSQFGTTWAVLLFGHPQASEDDAERAVRTAQGLTERFREAAQEKRRAFALPICAIASGIAVIREQRQGGPAAIGVAEAEARRLLGLARPGSIVICDDTRRLTRGLFVCARMESTEGGESQRGRQAAAWSVIREAWQTGRLAALRSISTPFIGRDEEVELVLRRWRRSAEGHGQVVHIQGEPGIGKSRLCRVARQTLSGEVQATLVFDCSPLHTHTALYPISQHIARAARLTPGDTGDELDRKLEAVLGLPTGAGVEDIAIFAALVSHANPDARRPEGLSPEAIKARTLQAIIDQLKRLCEEKRVLLLIEDLQWADPTSLQVLSAIVERAVDMRILVLTTSRENFRLPWPNHPHVTTIPLSRLGRPESRSLVEATSSDVNLAEDVMQFILERADGIPMFVEELTRTIVASLRDDRKRAMTGGQADAVSTLPPALQGLLQMRLDAVPGSRDLARIASAIGREVPQELLRRVSDVSEGALHSSIDELVNAEILMRRGFPGDHQTLVFRHFLIRDVAYGGLTLGERRKVHARIADELEKSPTFVGRALEVLGHHYYEAHSLVKAIHYWTRAAQVSAQRSAMPEAEALLTRALAATEALPLDAEGSRARLSVHLGLGPVFAATRGYCSDATMSCYARADAFAGGVAIDEEKMDILFGLFNGYYISAQIERAFAAAREHHRLAERKGSFRGRAATLLGQVNAAAGNFPLAAKYFEDAIGEFSHSPEDVTQLGAFPSQEVVCHALNAGVCYAFGAFDKAQAASRKAIELATAAGHDLSIALATTTDLMTPIPGGLKPDPERAADAEAFCASRGFRNFQVLARFARGSALVRMGEERAGLEIMQDAIRASDEINSRLLRPAQLGVLARLYLKAGEAKTALKTVRTALRISEETGEAQAKAGLQRLLSETHAALGNRTQALRYMRAALETASAQGAGAEVKRLEQALRELTA